MTDACEAARAKHGTAPLGRHEVEAVLDAVHDIVILACRGGEVLFANEAAHELFERGDVLRLVSGRIAGSDGAPQPALGNALERACSAGGTARLPVVLHRPEGIPLVFLVRCLDGSGRALLLARDTEMPLERVAGQLRALFGLTRSEAEVAVHFALGHSSAQIAARRGVAVGTIKSQLKALAAKLGVLRRSHIAAIVRTLPHRADIGPSFDRPGGQPRPLQRQGSIPEKRASRHAPEGT